jgi:hypothetical protein
MRRRALLTALAASPATVATSGCLSTARSLVSGPRTVVPGDEVIVENTSASRETLALAVTHDNIYDKYWTRRVGVDAGIERGVSFEPPVAVTGDDGLEVSVDWGLDSFAKTVAPANDGTVTDEGRLASTATGFDPTATPAALSRASDTSRAGSTAVRS